MYNTPRYQLAVAEPNAHPHHDAYEGIKRTTSDAHFDAHFGGCDNFLYDYRVGDGVAPPPPTPPDMRARIRRFVKPSD